MKVDKYYLRILIRHGTGDALPSRALAWACKSTDRDIRLTIRDLIAEGLPIASSTDGKNGGYFIASTPEEAKDYIGKLRHRIIQDCLRLRDFKRAARPLLEPGQLPLL